jgi:hypothetical protein
MVGNPFAAARLRFETPLSEAKYVPLKVFFHVRIKSGNRTLAVPAWRLWRLSFPADHGGISLLLPRSLGGRSGQ